MECFISNTIPNKVNCGRCIVYSLNDSVKNWAKNINKYISSGNHMELDELKLREFDIEYMVEQCEKVYKRAIN